MVRFTIEDILAAEELYQSRDFQTKQEYLEAVKYLPKAKMKLTPKPIDDTPQQLPDLMVAAEVIKYLRISTSTLYRLLNEDRFPKPLSIYENKRIWRRVDIENWLEARANGDK